jgi:DNA modification methylase
MNFSEYVHWVKQHFKGKYWERFKSLKLMSFLIILGSKKGDLILESFCGSGTSCITTQFLKRNFYVLKLIKTFAIL